MRNPLKRETVTRQGVSYETGFKTFAILAFLWAIFAAGLTLFGQAFEAIPVAIVALTFAVLNQSDE
jgi:hypothetical protein